MTWKRHRKGQGSTLMRRGSVHFYVLACMIFSMGASAAADEAIPSREPPESTEADGCRHFGPGYFKLAGTETCIKIGGSIRFDVGGGVTTRGDGPSED